MGDGELVCGSNWPGVMTPSLLSLLEAIIACNSRMFRWFRDYNVTSSCCVRFISCKHRQDYDFRRRTIASQSHTAFPKDLRKACGSSNDKPLNWSSGNRMWISIDG